MISSFVFPTFKTRNFFSHQWTNLSTSCRQCESSSFVISLVSPVSSASLSIGHESWELLQTSCCCFFKLSDIFHCTSVRHCYVFEKLVFFCSARASCSLLPTAYYSRTLSLFYKVWNNVTEINTVNNSVSWPVHTHTHTRPEPKPSCPCIQNIPSEAC